jgi:hypothetical protein
MTANFELVTDDYETIEIDVLYHWQESSSNVAEYWGSFCNEKTENYPIIDKIEARFKEDQEPLEKYLKSKYNQIIEELTEKIINLYL